MESVGAIEVATGVLVDPRGRVLLMQRLPGKHLAGLWEFPGGKLEPGETVEQALIRELDEELGITVLASEPLISLPWRYPEKSVRLHALRVTAWRGEPRAREGHPLRWVALQDMDAAEMPAADVPMVAALRLPAYYAINKMGSGSFFTRRHAEGMAVPKNEPDPISPPSPPSQRLGKEGWGEGVRPPVVLWQLRMPQAGRDEIRRVARDALVVNPELRDSLLLNHDIELARELGVGVHLKATQLHELHARPLPRNAWVGASCHDAQELELAARFGIDFATLSPVCATTSHPGAEPLGWEHFARLVADARLPVYALGGVGPDDLETARGAGAQGVAGIRAFL
ncbi:MAG: 8-oxo-dGTP diphosphatase MutT [Rhodanobacteraceae bacterium]